MMDGGSAAASEKLVAPREFSLDRPDPALDERVAWIERLIAHQCRRSGQDHVRLEEYAGG